LFSERGTKIKKQKSISPGCLVHTTLRRHIHLMNHDLKPRRARAKHVTLLGSAQRSERIENTDYLRRNGTYEDISHYREGTPLRIVREN